MKKYVRLIALLIVCGGAVQLAPGRAGAQGLTPLQRSRFFFAALHPLPHFAFSPLTTIGHFLALRNALAYSGAFGGLRPAYVGPGYGLPYPPIPPYAMLYGMPYPGGYGTMSTYATGYAAMASYGATGNYGSTAQVATAAKPVSALDSLRKHGGGLDWPLGLRVLEPKDASKDLRQQIDDAVETVFRQSEGTDTTPKTLQQVAKDVDKLGRMYKEHVWDMALTRKQEADAKEFLRKVRAALAAAEESAQASSQSQLVGSRKPRPEQTNEVAVYDNYFEPKSIEVAAGTKVRWTSNGTHQHTVTADNDEWLSMDVAPGMAVTVTFNKPGTYRYHCNAHPKEMRGTVVVK